MTDQKFNEIQQAAIDLYHLGLNVFPVPSPQEVTAWVQEEQEFCTCNNKRDKFAKPPYLLSVVFNNRLHLCDDSCKSNYMKGGKSCLPEHLRFENLFYDSTSGYKSNIACMLGRTSGNLMVLDCDSELSFYRTREIIKLLDIDHWEYSSSRGGGVLLRILEGEVKNKLKCEIEDVQIFGNRHFVVLPPSIHRTGVFYQWLNRNPFMNGVPSQLKPVSINVIEFLGIDLVNEYKSSLPPKIEKQMDFTGYPDWIRKLSSDNQEFLLNGVKINERNNRLFSAACDMRGNGIEYEKAEDFLLRACQKCVPPYPESDAYRTIQSAYSTKRTPARGYNLPINDWEAAIEFCKKFNWRLYGRSWKSDQAVFLAAIERAKMEKRSSFRCSVREISELSNLTLETVINSLSRLSGRYTNSTKNGIPPLLLFDHSSNHTNVRYYRFSDEVKNITLSEQYFLLVDNSVRKLFIPNPKTSLEKDIFKKIGMIGWKVWKYLMDNPEKTTSEISDSLSIPIYSIRRVLSQTNNLQFFNFVFVNNENKTFCSNNFSEEKMKKIALEIGSYGKSEKVKQRYQRDREIRANQKIAEVREKWLERRWNWEQKNVTDRFAPPIEKNRV